MNPGSIRTTVLALSLGACAGQQVPRPAASHVVVQRVSLMGGPLDLAVAPNGRFCVTRMRDRSLTCGQITDTAVIDRELHQIEPPAMVRLNGDGTIAYVVNITGIMLVIDVNGNAIEAHMPMMTSAMDAVSQPGAAVLYTSDVPGNVWVMNTNLREFVDTLNVGKAATGMALDTARKRLYAISRTARRLSVVNTVTDSTVAEYALDQRPRRVAVCPGADSVLVTDDVAGLSAMDLSSGRRATVRGVSYGAFSVTMAPDCSQAWVTVPNRNMVQIV